MSSFRGLRQLVAQSSLGRRGSSDSVSSMDQEDRSGQETSTNLLTVMQSERALQEFLQASAIGNPDDHLVEFAEALRTVARALRCVSESKARALEEAAEWKRKYELECLRNLQQNNQNLHPLDGKEFFRRGSLEDEINEAKSRKASEEQNGYCSAKSDISIRKHFCGLGVSNPDKEGDPKVPCGKASFSLAWGTASEKNRRHKHDVVSFESGDITTQGRSSRQIILEWDSPPQSVVILSKPNSVPVQIFCKEMIRWLKEEKCIIIYVEPHVKKELIAETRYFGFVQSWESDNEVLDLHKKVDLVITLGGDGTVLWAASIFKGPVPPLVSFAMGSLGFMTPFQSEYYKECLQMVMKGPVSITLRHRLQCQILRAPENESADPQKIVPDEIHLVLNEVSIDRGASSFLTNLECYCDNFFVTCVQGDGLILSTTSGSTAYSLAAGGSMVHPQVPGILFTPICPHSLSFRPLILPEYVTIRVQVPLNSRGQAWASFDGKDRRQLKAGDALLCSMSLWPVPTACESESTHDFLRSVREGLHWNLRKLQALDGHEMGLSKFGGEEPDQLGVLSPSK